MKALVFHGPRDIRYEAFPDPVLSRPHHAIIEVSHCSICGSDLHLYHGDRVGPMDFSQPQPQFCTGHETIGRVVEVGADVKTLRVGDRLLVAGGAGCGLCRFCLAGDLRRCASGRPAMVYGFSPYMNGGQANYMEVFAADTAAMRIPDGVTDEQAVLMTDAMATGHYGLVSSRFEPGDTVCVIGQGPVGLMAAEVAMGLGAKQVFTVDPVEARRELSRGFGATPVPPDEALAVIREATRG
ncbi:MAG: alcohol dehydrogenase catalytic domain-containing protein, partial [Pseudomonadota bacterium]